MILICLSDNYGALCVYDGFFFQASGCIDVFQLMCGLKIYINNTANVNKPTL